MVYAADLDTGEAVQVAYEATSSDSKTLADAAAILRGQIENSHATANGTQWPPSAEDLKSEAKMLPKTLLDFLALTLYLVTFTYGTEYLLAKNVIRVNFCNI